MKYETSVTFNYNGFIISEVGDGPLDAKRRLRNKIEAELISHETSVAVWKDFLKAFDNDNQD